MHAIGETDETNEDEKPQEKGEKLGTNLRRLRRLRNRRKLSNYKMAYQAPILVFFYEGNELFVVNALFHLLFYVFWTTYTILPKTTEFSAWLRNCLHIVELWR
ncbi:hypothetical protein RO3G_00562 [Rhizopus delemar RA 99-880]|uniref:Uncharacterized protein n=1 Tax=Rhizopus delemar (strain RA 99-880 / ATCC MYA-4621 / FGSC 9543 / NRRL 43880) TaxID=246409 RepID=I1BI28_RHIO9|nr:hypothetical protein RO3G_00562 [Rhizopus delemar RA 99-880]|eukprot:EIE75858.1 hypothetical protein RO3G_00562 [Rhizopus delemar RA 99-880]